MKEPYLRVISDNSIQFFNMPEKYNGKIKFIIHDRFMTVVPYKEERLMPWQFVADVTNDNGIIIITDVRSIVMYIRTIFHCDAVMFIQSDTRLFSNPEINSLRFEW